jgi:beta-glucanase (GH16 family)
MKKTLWLSVAAFCFLSGTSFAANNLLVNGDFEAGGSGQFGTYPYPSSWAGWGSNGSQHSDTGYRKDLKGVVFLWNDTGLFQDFAAVADRAYTISADVITPSSAPIKVWTGQISVEWYDETGGQIMSDTVGALMDTDPNNTWKTVKNTFFAPEGAKIGRVILTLGGSLVPDGLGGYLNSGKAYFDNVAVIGLEPDYNNDDMVKLDDFATASATWLGTSEITDLTGDSFFGLEDLGCFAMNWLQPIPDYELVWSDEFDGTSVDTSKWVYDVGTGQGGWGNSQLEYDTAGLNASVSGGNLIIEARSESYGGRSYTSTRMKTKGKHDFTYGKLEARIKIPSTKGIWPAFWMMPTDNEYGGWAASGEIDIMESINQAVKVYGTIHYGGAWPANHSSGGSYTGVPDFSTDFHVYAIEWEPTRIRWYVDGNLYSTKTSWYSTGWLYPAPFDKRFYFLLNVAVGGTWPGPPDGTSVFPQYMVVDYVRVYKKAK